jgi:transposase
MLYEAAQSMLRWKKWSWLKAWAMQVGRRCGMKKAIVALARRLAVILHRIWVDGTEFRWTREAVIELRSQPYAQGHPCAGKPRPTCSS